MITERLHPLPKFRDLLRRLVISNCLDLALCILQLMAAAWDREDVRLEV
jgi:hypothetical protein